jgi:hypothetical protein
MQPICLLNADGGKDQNCFIPREHLTSDPRLLWQRHIGRFPHWVDSLQIIASDKINKMQNVTSLLDDSLGVSIRDSSVLLIKRKNAILNSVRSYRLLRGVRISRAYYCGIYAAFYILSRVQQKKLD